MNYRLIRTKRKTIALYITDSGLEVRAPKRATLAEIDRFVRSKSKWIESHLEEREKRLSAKKEFKLSYGSKVQIRGKEYPIVSASPPKPIFRNGEILLPQNLDSDQIRSALVALYKDLATERIRERVRHYSSIMNVRPTSVRIGSAKTRWGSCSGDNRLNFTWFLIMADDETLDYVVVHELAHTIQHNHSKAFWEIVAKAAPTYKEQRTKLKVLQQRLSQESW
ncbi:MAG: M48 family metallopeptidase [Clostridiales Family XIII bacterium]|jgi:predicted metal-dependent hydrolase|nr:M48 family metallopeptidase [Clostridiales Family XIII bacterium]